MTPVSPEDLVNAGRFHEAAVLMGKQIAPPHSKVSAKDVMLFARALMATSRYDEAFNVLHLAMTDRTQKARALGMQSEIRWIQHRYDEAYNLSLASLELDLFNGRVQTIRNRCRQTFDTEMCVTVPGGSANRRLGHAAFYVAPGGNFGDLALPPTIRDTVAHWRPVSEWTSFHVHQRFGRDQVEQLNDLDGLVIGGGGLFLPDTSPNGDSGWQWNITLENLQAIEVPIHVMAVGYNLFQGQSFHGDTFRHSLRGLVDHSTVVGLRNSGSIAQVKGLLPEGLRDKVTYMPCPTTILSRLIPDDLEAIDVASTRKRVFLNGAFDRSERRFGAGYGQFLDHMARYVSNLQREGLSVELAAHLPRDEKLGKDLYAQYGIEMPVHGFYDMSCIEGYNLYRKAGLVVGMRGHASMIPFGLGVPILSLVSHPKMQFFLDDIERPDWGIPIGREHLSDDLYRASVDILENNQDYRDDLKGIQDRLYDDCAGVVGQIS
jgi:polysaccharide pyruvyl transferase WcaK-like protein